MKPSEIPISENQLQASLVQFLEKALKPELDFFAIPNGEKRHIGVAIRLKGQGVRRGVPDLAVLLPEGRIAWLEMKIKGGSLSPDQKAFRDKAKSLGHFWGVARTLDQAIEFLASIGALKGTHIQ
jgi:hypothetical protein